MTEPEELDEDLFADLYDADEPTTTATPTTQLKPDPQPVEPVPSTLAEPPPVDVKEEDNSNNNDNNNINGSRDTQDPGESAYINGQDDRESSRWDNNGRGSRMDVAIEQDSGSIGIKEDG
ncbi:MAG: hypothetical protein Q9168_006244 [Polycauliona sp. 1 TL-2023]